MGTMYESYVESQVESRKRIYVACQALKTALRETAPNMRDFSAASDFEKARDVYSERMEGVSRLMVAVTNEAKALQKGESI
jgi:hypothetical protein